MVVVYVLLGILAVNILLLCTKITMEFHYEETGELFIRVGFIKIRILPVPDWMKKLFKKLTQKKPEEEKPPEEEEKKEEEEEKEPEEPKGESFLQRFKREQGFSGIMQFLGDILHALGSMFGDIIRRTFVVQKLFLRLRIGTSDAASTALTYGKVCAAVYPALGILCSQFRVREYDADIAADYLAGTISGQLVFAVSMRPIKLIAALMKFVFRVIVAALKTKKRARERKKQSVAIERNVSHE